MTAASATGGMTAGDLLARTAELVGIPSVSHHEAAIGDHVATVLAGCPWLTVERLGDNVVARTTGGRRRRLLVAGHLDTVPPAGNEIPRSEGDVLWGIGASDMKGGLAVMLDLATTVAQPAMDVTWCFYACEEVARAESGLGRLWDDRPDLLAADVAIVTEPTDGRVEAGCQGTMRLAVHLRGVRAHVARPFAGRNAIHRLAPLLDRVASWSGRHVELDGCTYVEQLQAVLIDGGVAANVVPDHVVLTLNHRYAPDRDARVAEAALGPLFSGIMEEELGDRLELVDAADGAPPGLGHPVLAALVARSGVPARAKVAWTDVARIWAHGIPAANFGPGDPLLAHHPDEHVTRSSLEHVRDVLQSLLEHPPPDDPAD